MPCDYITRTSCRVCGSKNLTPLFSLGVQAVSDFVDKADVYNGNKVPIDIELCNDCTLVQGKHTAPAQTMYVEQYWYRSGITQTMRDALRDVTKSIEERVKLFPGDVVLDIGSNDGTLLRSYSTPNLFKVGVEPAKNLVAEGRKGISMLINGMWDYGTFSEHMTTEATLETPAVELKCKVITAIGMFYDMDDPNLFVRDVALALAPDGLFVAQLMCLKQTLEKRDVGNFAHEHLEFYSLKSLKRLLGNHGLEIWDIEENNVNGGSYRLYIRQSVWVRSQPLSFVPYAENKRVRDAFYKEEYPALHDSLMYTSFFQEIDANRRKCVTFIQDEVDKGKRVWIYGASTKGNVIAQWYGLDKKHILAAADRDPNKWGKYTIETGIPITSEEQFRAANPDYALVLPYAFLPEFIERESEWRSRGGKFIVPLPEFKVI